MGRSNVYVFCKYQIQINEKTLSSEEEWTVFEKVKGKLIAYRKRHPNPEEADTYLLKPRNKILSDYRVHTWEVAQNVKYRERSKYEKDEDEIIREIVETDEMRHTKFIGIPRLGVFAVGDKTSDRSLEARSAIGRFKAIIESYDENCDVSVEFAGSPQDAARALERWSLDQFSFTVRPFNPHPQKLGLKIHELLKKDNIGSVRGMAIPSEGQRMHDSHEGLISEAKGLADKGYGQYGARGTTDGGLRASIGKPKFSSEKEKNSQEQARNRVLKVYFEKGDDEGEEERAIVNALLDLYARS